MVQTAVGRIGGEGKVKLTLTRQIKSNVYTGGNTCQWHVHGDVNITLWLRVSVREPLSSPLVQTAISLTASYLFLCGFKKPIWQRQRANNSLWIVWLLSKRLNKKKKEKKSVFRINPVSSWTLRTEWQTDGAKKCEQCQWAQCWFKWAIQGGRRQLKLKVWALFTVWSGTIHSFVLFYKNDWGLLHNEINWFSIWYRQVIHILWFWMVRKLWNLYFRAAKHFEEDWRTRERTKM